MSKKKDAPEPALKTWLVTIPIAGHVTVEVQAGSEEEAIEKAQDEASDGDVTWETLTTFNTGNVCHCPQPWKVEVKEVEE